MKLFENAILVASMAIKILKQIFCFQFYPIVSFFHFPIGHMKVWATKFGCGPLGWKSSLGCNSSHLASKSFKLVWNPEDSKHLLKYCTWCKKYKNSYCMSLNQVSVWSLHPQFLFMWKPSDLQRHWEAVPIPLSQFGKSC